MGNELEKSCWIQYEKFYWSTNMPHIVILSFLCPYGASVRISDFHCVKYFNGQDRKFSSCPKIRTIDLWYSAKILHNLEWCWIQEENKIKIWAKDGVFTFLTLTETNGATSNLSKVKDNAKLYIKKKPVLLLNKMKQKWTLTPTESQNAAQYYLS